jgi:hypothetical protein
VQEIIAIAAGADDLYSTRNGATWPPTGMEGYWAPGDEVLVRKINATTIFVTDVGYLRFDTGSVLPDTCVITGATLRAYMRVNNNDDARSLCADFYDWQGNDLVADHAFGDLSGGITPVPLSAITPNALNDFPLLNPDANVSKTGPTKLRLSITGGQPANWNGTTLAAFESTDQEPRLIVDYVFKSSVLPDGVAAQSGYANATTGNITNLHGDPDVAGGTGFTAS